MSAAPLAALGIDLVGSLAGLVALAGMVLVLPLYASQARDLRRLRAWRRLEPHRGDPDPFAPPAAAPGPEAPAPLAPATGMSEAARRVTSERSTRTRITMERPALAYDSGAGGIASRIPQPRHPLAVAGAIAAVAVLLSALALLIWTVGLGSGVEDGGPQLSVEAGEFGVTILNGTSKAGATRAAMTDVAAQGFELVGSASSREAQRTSVIYYSSGSGDAARVLGREIGVDEIAPVPDSLRVEAIGAELLFVIGDDRIKRR